MGLQEAQRPLSSPNHYGDDDQREAQAAQRSRHTKPKILEMCPQIAEDDYEQTEQEERIPDALNQRA